MPGTVAWPGPDMGRTSLHTSLATRAMASQATQTDPRTQAISYSKQGLPVSQQDLKPNGKQPAPSKKGRRRPGKEYLIAARQRREQQEYQNYHHPPAPEDEWICEFCEYERIFGSPPEALIRQYEIKDRRVRKQEAERRRLLEKAKLKGRKGKKGSKIPAKNATATQDRQVQGQAAQQPALREHSQSQSQGTQSEDYYEDEYDDEYAQDGLPPSPTGPPLPQKYDSHLAGPKTQLAPQPGIVPGESPAG